MNRRVAAGLGFVVALLIALVIVGTTSGGDRDPVAASSTAAPTTSGPVTTSAAPTTRAPIASTTTSETEPETTTTLDRDDPSVLDTVDLTDPVDIWTELLAYHNWVFQHPEDAELGQYLDPRCACNDFIAEQIDEYVANGWREDDEGIVLDRIEVKIATSNGLILDVYDRHVEQRIVDGDGTVVRTAPARALSWFVVTLHLEPNVGWRILEWQYVGDVSEGG